MVLVPVGEPAALDRLRPRAPAVLALLHEHPRGRRLRRRDRPPGGGRCWRGRSWRGAAGPLCAYLHGRLGLEHIEILQGVAMGRPSVLRCTAGERVRVEGDVVVVAEADLHREPRREWRRGESNPQLSLAKAACSR